MQQGPDVTATEMKITVVQDAFYFLIHDQMLWNTLATQYFPDLVSYDDVLHELLIYSEHVDIEYRNNVQNIEIPCSPLPYRPLFDSLQNDTHPNTAPTNVPDPMEIDLVSHGSPQL